MAEILVISRRYRLQRVSLVVVMKLSYRFVLPSLLGLELRKTPVLESRRNSPISLLETGLGQLLLLGDVVRQGHGLDLVKEGRVLVDFLHHVARHRVNCYCSFDRGELEVFTQEYLSILILIS